MDSIRHRGTSYRLWADGGPIWLPLTIDKTIDEWLYIISSRRPAINEPRPESKTPFGKFQNNYTVLSHLLKWKPK